MNSLGPGEFSSSFSQYKFITFISVPSSSWSWQDKWKFILDLFRPFYMGVGIFSKIFSHGKLPKWKFPKGQFQNYAIFWRGNFPMVRWLGLLRRHRLQWVSSVATRTDLGNGMQLWSFHLGKYPFPFNKRRWGLRHGKVLHDLPRKGRFPIFPHNHAFLFGTKKVHGTCFSWICHFLKLTPRFLLLKFDVQ